MIDLRQLEIYQAEAKRRLEQHRKMTAGMDAEVDVGSKLVLAKLTEADEILQLAILGRKHLGRMI